MGIMFGHLLKLDSLGPAIGGVTVTLRTARGAYALWSRRFFLFDVVKCLPSYWLGQAGKTALVVAAALGSVGRRRGVGGSCFRPRVRVYQPPRRGPSSS